MTALLLRSLVARPDAWSKHDPNHNNRAGLNRVQREKTMKAFMMAAAIVAGIAANAANAAPLPEAKPD